MEGTNSHINFSKKNINAFNITYSDQFILIEPELKQMQTQLILQRKSLKIIQQNRAKKFVFKLETKTKPVSLILGILQLFEQSYLLFVNEVYFAGKFLDNSIYHLATIDYLPLSIERPTEDRKKKIAQIFHEIQNEIFSFGFYFSFDIDITLNYPEQIKGVDTQNCFYWNQHLMKIFADQHISRRWFIPIIQGYFGRFQSTINALRVQYFLFSRRSKFKSGTRFYARGINDQGYCANFVESQHIIKLNDKVMSHLSVRGSVPIFWQQRSLTSPIRLTRNKQLTKIAFLSHFKQLNRRYGRVVVINLLQKSKADENLLTKAFEQLFSECYSEIWQFVRYKYFDLHQAIKTNSSEKTNLFIHNLTGVLDTFSYFMYDLKKQTVLTEQNGVFRINCLDCLGRSGNLMHKIAFLMIDLMFRDHDILLESAVFSRDIFQEIDAQAKDCHPFTNLFKYVWADNADFLSKIYCGTQSMSSNVTRLGKKSFFEVIDSSLLSLARIYNYKFEDQLKQKCLDLLLGHIKSKPDQQDISKGNQYSFKIFISTWNTNASDPKKCKLDLILNNIDTPNLIVFAIQQMIPLNPNNVINTQQDGKMSDKWLSVLENQIGKLNYKYIFIDKVELVGLWMAVYIAQNSKHMLKGVQRQVVKTGMGGNFGNKGAVIIRLKIQQSTICLTNCHLEAGEKQQDMRFQNIIDIHQKAFQQNIKGIQNEAKIQQSDYKFLFGDLNFRINKPSAEVRSKLQQMDILNMQGQDKAAFRILDQLIRYDQLTVEKRNIQASPYIIAYTQSPISFKPTYKFEKGLQQYDKKKNRVPSWCDRILLWSEASFTQSFYKSISEIMDSDHKPVVSEYTIGIMRKEQVLKNDTVENKFGFGKEFRDSQFQFN